MTIFVKKMKKLLVLLYMCPFLFAFSSASSAQSEAVVTDSGLKYVNLVVGTGEMASPGKIVAVHITGWLDDDGRKGKQIISSYDRGKPVAFKVGTAYVMKAWNEGIIGMKTGGKRRLWVPPELGFGARKVGNEIPANAHLIFDVELLEVR